MSDAFISYRRKPSAPQASLLQEKLKNQHDIDAYLDTTRTDSTKVSFPERLMGAIEEAPTFILMLGDITLESEWVLKEIYRAYELKKHCIPIFQESYVVTSSQDPAINYVLSFDGVHLFDVKNIMIDASVADIARLVIRHPIPHPKRNFAALAVGMVVLLAVIVTIILADITRQNDLTTPTPQVTNTQVVARVTEELSATNTHSLIATFSSNELINFVIIASSFQSRIGCLGDWDPACINSELNYMGDGVYERTFTIPPGSYEYRIVLDGSWNKNYGRNCESNGANIRLSLIEETEVTFIFNQNTYFIRDSVNQQTDC